MSTALNADPAEVLPFLWLGSKKAAKNKALLKKVCFRLWGLPACRPPPLTHGLAAPPTHTPAPFLLQIGVTHVLNMTPTRTTDPVAGIPNYFEKEKAFEYRYACVLRCLVQGVRVQVRVCRYACVLRCLVPAMGLTHAVC